MINSVSSLFSDKVCIAINKRLKHPPYLVLVEDGRLSAIKKLFLLDLPINSYAISLDILCNKFNENEKIQFSRLNHYLDKANSTGINKRCDLVLFTENNGNESVYIFDLKSADPDPEDVCMQLMNSEIYIKYILELAKFFNKKNISGISFFKVVGTTRVRKQVSYANPELRAKIARKNKLYEQYNIKEVTILPENRCKAKLRFAELARLF
ncbi:TPA: hypothetical protein RGJ92_004155 [Cronobacter sakazakii]|nr:hypothetical protein [Cronobacter sakazakii]